MADLKGQGDAPATRGASLQQPRHPDSCSSRDELYALASDLSSRGVPLAADLFCGAGGLSLGLQDAGFEVIVGVDHDPDALATHAALTPGLHLDWDLGDEGRVEELSEMLSVAGVTMIAGGPPCQPFSKAGRSLIRDLVRQGRRPPQDHRRDLWQSFVAIVERVRPPAVLMENVPDMALDRDMLILRTMIDEFERLDYGVEARVIDTSKYGVPQYRQRLILVAVEGRRHFTWPHEAWQDAPFQTRLWDAIGDLPDVEPGWQADRTRTLPYGGPKTPFQVRARERVAPKESTVVHDHVTRPVRPDDLEAFQLLTTDMKYSELPDHLKRYRDDIFDDKYKRLGKFDLSRTITAHLAKDGYWYIHPVYHRTLTIREAARIQTFRDDVRFSGPPTAALRQIGNAVPPLLAEQLGRAVLASLGQDQLGAWTTREISQRLARWFAGRANPSIPWLLGPSRWTVIAAEILLHRARPTDIRHVWPIVGELTEPTDTVKASAALRRIGRLLEREDRVEQLLTIAEALAEQPSDLESHAALVRAGVPTAVADVALRVHPTADDDPVVAPTPVLRVAARFHGSDVDVRNKRSDGRMSVARLVGVDPPELDSEAEATGHLAHLGLIEVAAAFCRPDGPDCGPCPLNQWCVTGAAELKRSPTLFAGAGSGP